LQFKGAAAVAVFCIAVVLAGHFCYTVSGGGAMTQENDVATWIYMVHLTRPTAITSPTEEESAAIDRHFAHLQQVCSAGTVRLAGPAMDGAFGIVIFEPTDETTVHSFIAKAPALCTGVMTAELHPFHISLEHPPCR
jgi:uncharacterized protein YciI